MSGSLPGVLKTQGEDDIGVHLGTVQVLIDGQRGFEAEAEAPQRPFLNRKVESDRQINPFTTIIIRIGGLVRYGNLRVDPLDLSLGLGAEAQGGGEPVGPLLRDPGIGPVEVAPGIAFTVAVGIASASKPRCRSIRT